MSQRRTVFGSMTWSAVAAAVGLALIAGPRAAWSQATAPASAPAAEPGAKQVSDLSTRYKFLERYQAAGDGKAAAPQHPGEIGQYRVASRDVIRVVTDKPQGAPDRQESSVQVIYTERAGAM